MERKRARAKQMLGRSLVERDGGKQSAHILLPGSSCAHAPLPPALRLARRPRPPMRAFTSRPILHAAAAAAACVLLGAPKCCLTPSEARSCSTILLHHGFLRPLPPQAVLSALSLALRTPAVSYSTRSSTNSNALVLASGQMPQQHSYAPFFCIQAGPSRKSPSRARSRRRTAASRPKMGTETLIMLSPGGVRRRTRTADVPPLHAWHAPSSAAAQEISTDWLPQRLLLGLRAPVHATTTLAKTERAARRRAAGDGSALVVVPAGSVVWHPCVDLASCARFRRQACTGAWTLPRSFTRSATCI
jgi:hypothetical protein